MTPKSSLFLLLTEKANPSSVPPRHKNRALTAVQAPAEEAVWRTKVHALFGNENVHTAESKMLSRPKPEFKSLVLICNDCNL